MPSADDVPYPPDTALALPLPNPDDFPPSSTPTLRESLRNAWADTKNFFQGRSGTSPVPETAIVSAPIKHALDGLSSFGKWAVVGVAGVAVVLVLLELRSTVGAVRGVVKG